MLILILKLLGLKQIRFTVTHKRKKTGKTTTRTKTELFSVNDTIQHVNDRLIKYRLEVWSNVMPDLDDRFDYTWEEVT